MPFINDMLQSNQQQKPPSSPLKTVPTRYKIDVRDTMERLRSRIYGQDQAMLAVENMLKVVCSDISDPSKPLYVGLFLGPTGVGKTEIVRALAETIHGSKDSFCRVDMNTLAQDHYAAAVTGAPPGYVGSKEGSTILDKEKIEGSFSKPGIVLFDELEKAGPQVLLSLLNIFDNGVMTISTGDKVIDFRNCLIFMTSNLAASEIFRLTDDSPTAWFKRFGFYLNPFHWKQRNGSLLDRIVKRRLEKTFKPEFVNRMDDIVIFNWLKRDTLDQIAGTLIQQINQRLRKHNCTIEADPTALRFLIRKGYDKKFGARAFKRAFRLYMEVPLAELLMNRHVNDPPCNYVAHHREGALDIHFFTSHK